jgi:hypothetical protein
VISQIGKKFEGDRLLQAAQISNNALARGRGLMNSPGVVTNGQVLDLLSNDISTAVSGAKGATEGQREHTSWDSIDKRIANFVQKVSDKPEQAASPEALGQFKGLLDELESTTSAQAQARAHQIGDPYVGALSTPGADAFLTKMIRQYETKHHASSGGAGQKPAAKAAPQAKAAAVAQQAGKKATKPEVSEPIS